MASTKKVDQVQNIVNDLQKNPNFALVSFDKTTHQSLENLRRELRKNNSQFAIAKNTLFEKAVIKLSQINKYLVNLRKTIFH